MSSISGFCGGMMLVVLAGPVNGQTTKEVIPFKMVSPVVLTGQKDHTYYALSKKVATELKVYGPGELTVYSRVRIPEEQSWSDKFYLRYVVDGHSVSNSSVPKLAASAKLSFKSKLSGKPTKAHKSIIRIPPGKHYITVFKSKTSQPVHARFRFKLFNRPIWKTVLPNNAHLEKVKLRYKDGKQTPTYYRITDKTEFRFVVADTARIRIQIRDEFTYKMLEENNLRIIVSQTGQETKTYKFMTKRAKHVSYVKMNKLVPSYLRSLYFDLPNGAADRELSIRVSGFGKSAIIRVSTDMGLVRSKKPN